MVHARSIHDDSGRLIENQSWMNDGTPDSSLYLHNDAGRHLRTFAVSRDRHDNHGNWVERTVLMRPEENADFQVSNHAPGYYLPLLLMERRRCWTRCSAVANSSYGESCPLVSLCLSRLKGSCHAQCGVVK